MPSLYDCMAKSDGEVPPDAVLDRDYLPPAKINMAAAKAAGILPNAKTHKDMDDMEAASECGAAKS